jgi:hypothetical protein
LSSTKFLVTFPDRKNNRTSVELLSNLLHIAAIGTAGVDAGAHSQRWTNMKLAQFGKKTADEPRIPAEDDDPEETREWLESLEAVVLHAGHARGAYLLKQLETQARQLGIVANAPPYAAYQNCLR